jgi:glucose/arabinose dehydrogenase
LPDGEILVTERSGRVRIIESSGNLRNDPIATIDEVKHISEGGLLGITISPNFEDNDYVYLYYTYGESGENTLNKVVRYKFSGENLEDPETIIEGIPGAPNHNGGRIKFGPDGFLYITTGDAQNPSLSQETNALAGKILRVTEDGDSVPGNPFGNAVYSYGHRNPQGIVWDSQGNLWETEHGASATDELNLIERGKNYGWEVIRGDETKEGMETPVIHSGSSTWAPSGMAFLNGKIYFAGLRGVSLYVYDIANKSLTRHLNGELGRIRDVVVGPANMLFITTNNRDGRGAPFDADDKLIRVNPEKL